MDNKNILYIVAGAVALLLIYFLVKKRNQSDPFKNVPTPNTTSSGWIQWHKDLLEAGVEKTEAQRIFLNAFAKFGADNSLANDNNLRTYTRSQGFEVPEYSVVSSIYDTGVDTGRALDKGIGMIGNAFAIGALIIALGMGFVVYKIIKD